MPDIPGNFEDQIRHILPQTDADHLEVCKIARKVMTALLSEAPANQFVVVLRYPEPLAGQPVLCVAHSGSFGYYVGSMINAARWSPPLPDIKLTGFALPNGQTPRPELMLYRNALNEAIQQCDQEIASWQEKVTKNV